MTWIKFALWLCGPYAFYYGGLVLWDLFRSSKLPAAEDSHELTFVESAEPQRTDTDSGTEYFPSALTSSGGVNLKQLFNLAREEAIEYTRAVSFS
jgi:hypothetical protein